MTADQLQKLLEQGKPVKAVLLRSRRWLTAPEVVVVWATGMEGLWRIDLVDADQKVWHQFWCEGEEIVGLSVDNSGHADWGNE